MLLLKFSNIFLILVLFLYTGCARQSSSVSTDPRNVTRTSAAVNAEASNETLNLRVNGSGSITWSLTNTGGGCQSDCLRTFPSGSSTTIFAIPNPGYVLDAWSGDCLGGSISCQVLMNSSKSVTANFIPQQRLDGVSCASSKLLRIQKVGAGTVKAYYGELEGMVVSAPYFGAPPDSPALPAHPPVITCGTECSRFFDPAAPITLYAIPEDGHMVHWSGDCNGDSFRCSISMSSARSVTATFLPIPTPDAPILTTLSSGPYTLAFADKEIGSISFQISSDGVNWQTVYDYNGSIGGPYPSQRIWFTPSEPRKFSFQFVNFVRARRKVRGKASEWSNVVRVNCYKGCSGPIRGT